jgi:hypothetical protein
MGEILTPGQWDDLRIQLKRKHSELTDDDLPYYEAEEEDMLGMIKYRLQTYQERIKKLKHKINH